MLRDAAISLSLANLCFVKVWAKLLGGPGSYFMEFPIAYASIVVNVLLLAALFLLAVTIVRRSGNRILNKLAKWALLVAVLTALNGITWMAVTASSVNVATMVGRNAGWFAGVGLTAIAVLLIIKARYHVLRHAPRIILILLPFVLFTFSQAIWKLSRNVAVAQAADKAEAGVHGPRKKTATRVLWIVFDELDQRMAFAQRPATVELAELDRLRKQSIYATRAYPPAPLTYMSMPALITGRLVSKVTPLRGDKLMVTFADAREAVSWGTQPNVFSRAQGLGYKTALVGWCHPYCEVIGKSLSQCEEVKERQNHEITLKSSMFLQAEGLLSTIPLLPQTAIPLIQRVPLANRLATTAEREKYTVRHKRVLESALKAAADPDLDLVFVHSPIPHPPGIYDRTRDEFSLDSRTSYIDNLELVDRTIGDLRRAMEAAGIWDQTTVIVSSDHWWRADMWSRGPFWTRADADVFDGQVDHRVPFLIKIAGQQAQLTYDSGFNTVVTHDLVLSLMRGEQPSPGAVTAWLDRHRTIADSPYNRDEQLP